MGAMGGDESEQETVTQSHPVVLRGERWEGQGIYGRSGLPPPSTNPLPHLNQGGYFCPLHPAAEASGTCALSRHCDTAAMGPSRLHRMDLE